MNTLFKLDTVGSPRSELIQQLASFSSLDVGSPQLSGSTRKVDTGWDLLAGGVDIWEKSDQFHYVFKEVSGDFDIAVRVDNFVPAHL